MARDQAPGRVRLMPPKRDRVEVDELADSARAKLRAGYGSDDPRSGLLNAIADQLVTFQTAHLAELQRLQGERDDACENANHYCDALIEANENADRHWRRAAVAEGEAQRLRGQVQEALSEHGTYADLIDRLTRALSPTPDSEED